MRLLKNLRRSAPTSKPAARQPASPTAAPRPAKPSHIDAFAPLRAIADLDNEATRQIDEAQALLAHTLEECPAVYVDAAIERLKAARDLIRPLIEEQRSDAPAAKAD